ncbi:MAG: hypothetical protein ABIJ97_03725 [Bacteroidota bacterium]
MNMTNSELLQKITQNLNEITQILSRLKEDESIPAIEKDLLLEKIRLFYDSTIQLDTFVAKSQSVEPVATDEIREEEKSSVTVNQTDVNVDNNKTEIEESIPDLFDEIPVLLDDQPDILDAKTDIEPVEIQSKNIFEESVEIKPEESVEIKPEESVEIRPEESKVDTSEKEKSEIQPSLFGYSERIENNSQPNVIEKKIVQQAFDQKETIEEKYLSENKKSVNDIISELRKEKDLATQMQYKPVKDLKEAITLNDRVKYIREIFNQNKETYDLAIIRLNSCKDLDEAMEYINSNIVWDESKPSFRSFLELVYRRHIPVNN